MRRRSRSSNPRRVVVLASHFDSGRSMWRYGDLLADGYRLAGWDVRVLRPSRPFTSRMKPSKVNSGAVYYLEKLVLFPLTLLFRLRNEPFVHLTDHSDAPWLRAVPGATKVLVTCHDLIAILAAQGALPEHRPGASGRLYQRMIASSLTRADEIAAISGQTLSDVRTLFPTVASTLLHNPLSTRVTGVRRVPPRDAESPYLLIVSTSGWRKRRHLSIDVWRRLRATTDPDLRLVIVGDPLWDEERALAGVGDELPEGMEERGVVADEELAGLYAHALGVLMMSSHEGFGWPVIEANHWGTMVLCAELPVFREVGPGNVFLPDDLDGVDWAAVRRQLTDPERIARARRDTERFSPAAFAAALDTVALELLGAPSAADPAEAVSGR